jgi:ATP/maltotriose-dependent transcriptional regulator MalT
VSGREDATRVLVADDQHLHHLYEKLGVSDRAAAVAAAMRRGMLD